MRPLFGILVLLIGACAVEPNRDDPYEAPPEYAPWYRDVETCAHRSGSFARLSFFRLDSLDYRAGHREGNSIWIRPPFFTTRRVVEHEMLHTLIGDPEHARPEWVDCGLSPAQVWTP